tara:strand:+ start:170 stop:382 length:213 start_codon:yes stop_codon:yes gene_type:complete
MLDNTPRLTLIESMVVSEIVTTGDCRKTIAKRLKLSERALTFHISNVLRKYNVDSQLQLAAKHNKMEQNK